MREGRGITLEAIAAATKIGLSLLAALERSDVSHWPKGIFRRAFFRAYAAAIGAPVDDTLAEFLRLFPEDGAAVSVMAPPGPLRMTLAPGRSLARLRAMRLAAALADACLVAALGLVAAWWLPVDRSNGVAVAALLYYPLTAGWLGRGVAQTWLQDGVPAPARWRSAGPRAQHASATAHIPAESVREDVRAAGLPRDRRTGVDRRRVARIVRDHEAEPIAGLFGLRKGSAA